jgi:AcrR family transcriptional regulator
MSDREGYAAASIERIAKEAGTSKSTVLYHFKTKEAINRSVGQLLSENGAAYMTERIMAVDSSRERLQAHYLSSNLRFVARTPHTSTPSTASSRTSASTSARPMPCLRFDLDPDVPVRQPGRKRESTLAAAPSHRRGHPHSPSRPCSSSCPLPLWIHRTSRLQSTAARDSHDHLPPNRHHVRALRFKWR